MYNSAEAGTYGTDNFDAFGTKSVRMGRFHNKFTVVFILMTPPLMHVAFIRLYPQGLWHPFGSTPHHTRLRVHVLPQVFFCSLILAFDILII